jgi:hypothetical protein
MSVGGVLAGIRVVGQRSLIFLTPYQILFCFACLLDFSFDFFHRRMARGGHELPKVSPGTVMFDPSTLCERVTLETALRRVDGLRPSSTL